MLPSEYFDRNSRSASSNTRRRELGRRYEIGVGNIMWGNDFPHPEGTWPYTREFLKDRFWDIPDRRDRSRSSGSTRPSSTASTSTQLAADRRPHRPDARRPRPDRRGGVRQVGAVQEGRPSVAHRRRSRRDRSPTSDAQSRRTWSHMSENRWIQEPRHRRTARRRAVPGQPAPRGDLPHRSRDPRGGAAAAAHRAARARACACTSPASRSTGTCTRSCTRSCSTRCTATRSASSAR